MRQLFFLLAGCAAAFAGDPFSDLQCDLNQIVQKADSKTIIGVEVVSLKTGERLFEKNSNKLFIPASTMKLVTAAAALNVLGVDYRFETKLFFDEEGNLYLRGSGDPDLSRYDLEKLAVQLKMRQVYKISGNIVVDNTLFDEFSQGSGWMLDASGEYWNAPMDALTVDHNSIHVWVSPAKQLEEPPKIFLDPNLLGFPIQNRAVTGNLETLRVGRRLFPEDGRIEVEGTIPLGSEPLEFKVPVPAPAVYAGHILKEILQSKGIVVKGQVVRGKTPANGKSAAVHFSRPLSQIVQHMMKRSDNLYADCLFKKLGQVCLGAPGSWQKGSLAMREFLLNATTIDPRDMVVLDGSGLSRYNLVTPGQLVRLLKWAYRDFRIGAEFEAALPIAGVDGTLKSRMNQVKYRVRAKPGGMPGITGLAGYATTKDGELLAFAILINSLSKSVKEYRNEFEDEICARLAQFSREF
jgi:D-alanyl-D-alanine carboxypeptidase/D-alanyl-D-alanine-endopeptidase (penicillin-binding protein 4)